jgi:lysophospholipase L1-like esterase
MKNKNVFLIFFTICCLFFVQKAIAQPFVQDIATFKKKDSASFPPGNAILFVGSSSFTMWKDVQKYFPAFSILNRGFGGSSLSDVSRYAEDIIFPYQPKQIVIYCGENDLAGDSTITDKIVYQRFVELFNQIRNKMPDMPVAFISLKPSPSRWHLKDKMTEANNRIKKMLKKKKAAAFINVWDAMLNTNGKPMDDIFLEDKLHMNAKGYAIWQKIIEPFLIK